MPVALVLSLPAGFRRGERLRTMVFGVALLGIVVQGLLLPTVLRATEMIELPPDGPEGA